MNSSDHSGMMRRGDAEKLRRGEEATADLEDGRNIGGGGVTMKKFLRPTLILFVIAMINACNDKECHYQEGVATLTVSANPSSISAIAGESWVTAIGTGQDYLPMPDGTVVNFVSDMGAFEQGAVATTSGGIARIRFLSDGKNGTANIYARTGTTTSPTIQVKIGIPAVASMILIANPGTVDGEGGNVHLTATVYSNDQIPLQGIPVVFSTDNGRLASNGSPRPSDFKGQSKDTLTLYRNATGDVLEITVTATVGSTSATASIQQLKP
ncbi:MAG: hypothetical protein AB1714_29255 [Acidobacteriota bacterium]